MSPADQPEQHLTALRTIAGTLHSRDIREELKRALAENSVGRFVRSLDEPQTTRA